MRTLLRRASRTAIVLAMAGAAVFGLVAPASAVVPATVYPFTRIFEGDHNPRTRTPLLLAATPQHVVSPANLYCYTHGVRYKNRYGAWADVWVRADVDSNGWLEWKNNRWEPHSERHISYREWIRKDDVVGADNIRLPVCP